MRAKPRAPRTLAEAWAPETVLDERLKPAFHVLENLRDQVSEDHFLDKESFEFVLGELNDLRDELLRLSAVLRT